MPNLKPRKILTNILNPINKDTAEYRDNCVIEINEQNIITNLRPATKNENKSNFEDLTDSLLTPGLIDTHNHIPQLPIIGRYGDTLLEWLNKYTFPAEMKFKDTTYAQQIALQYLERLNKSGTTTSVSYATIHPHSTDTIFETIRDKNQSNLRLYLGKVHMDQNSPTELTEQALPSLQNAKTLCEKWDSKDETANLHYIYSPRFAISCTMGLLTEIGKLAKKSGSYIQTHLSENAAELEAVSKLFADAKDYLHIYESAGLLGSRTLLAHAIHVSDSEIDRIKKSDSRVIHCPDANLFLKSGRFPIEKFEEAGVIIGLGSDVGAGTTFNMFKIIRSMLYVQNAHEKEYASLEKGFYYSTLGNAKVLHLNKKIGSIQKGKLAEFTQVKFTNSFKPQGTEKEKASEILAQLVFGCDYALSAIKTT